MLIPQYTIRWLLTLTAVCAVVFSILGLAVRGSGWAQGVSAGIISLVVVLLIHAFLFTLVWAIAPWIEVLFSVVFPPGAREFLAAILRFPRRGEGPGQSPFVEGARAPGPSPRDPAASDNDHPMPADASPP